MPFLPDDPGTGDALRALSKLDPAILDQIVAAGRPAGVVSGCACTVSGSLGIAVASGVTRYGDSRRVVTGATVTAVPDATNPRKFLVTDGGNGTPTILHGTAAAEPDAPAITAGHVVIRSGVLPANLATITTSHFAGEAVAVPERPIIVTVGPYFFVNVTANGTLQGAVPFTASASSIATVGMDIKQGKAGRIIGMTLVSNAAVTAGTAILKARIATVVTDFAANACVLNTTNTRSMTAYDNVGLAFTAGQEISVAVVSASLSPTTLDMVAWMVLAIDPF